MVKIIIVIGTLLLTGCSNWQGMEIKFGIGQYNGAEEKKTFTKDVKPVTKDQ